MTFIKVSRAGTNIKTTSNQHQNNISQTSTQHQNNIKPTQTIMIIKIIMKRM